MADKFNAKDALADYVTVPQRIAQFYDLYGTGRLVTGEVRVEMGPDGKPRVIVQALAYRSPEDTLPGVGWSWMELPGTTSFTRGSELENTETSAWGRAIAALGILVDRSVASANEVKTKEGATEVAKTERVTAGQEPDPPVLVGPWTGTGKVIVRRTGPADGNLRQGPEGAFLIFAFATVDDRTIPQVRANGALAMDLLDAANGALDGMVGTIAGDLYTVPWEKEGRRMTFQRLELHRIETAGWTLPVPEPTAPMFDESELDAIPL